MEAINLEQFIENVSGELRFHQGGAETGRKVRDHLKVALTSATFVMDCVERVVLSMENNAEPGWQSLPIHDDAHNAYAIQLFYWAPEYVNRVHRHDEWTVTGVLHNALTFRTYKEGSNGRAVEDKRIEASAGDVGYIGTSSIHNVANPSQRESISIHVFPLPRALARSEPPSKSTNWYGSPDVGEIEDVLRFQARALTAFVALLASTDESRRVGLLDRVFALGGLPVKLAAVKAMVVLNRSWGAKRLSELALLCPPNVATELERMRTRLAGAYDHERA